jgi:hypothetical protein
MAKPVHVRTMRWKAFVSRRSRPQKVQLRWPGKALIVEVEVTCGLDLASDVISQCVHIVLQRAAATEFEMASIGLRNRRHVFSADDVVQSVNDLALVLLPS